MRKYLWQQFGFAVPEHWEMLRFSKRQDEGRCAFADRYQFRLEFSWKSVKSAPDLKELMSVYRTSLESEKRLTKSRSRRHRGWVGFSGTETVQQLAGTLSGGSQESVDEQLIVTRMGSYWPDTNRLLEAVFLWPGSRDEAEEDAILSAVREEGPNAAGDQGWRGFGMDLQVPASCRMESCRVEPANVALQFSGDRHCEWTVRRMGFVEFWLTGSLADWVLAERPTGATAEPAVLHRRAGHDIYSIQGQVRRKEQGRKAKGYRASAWTCPEDGRVYHVQWEGPSDEAPDVPDLPGYRLCCCQGLRGSG